MQLQQFLQNQTIFKSKHLIFVGIDTVQGIYNAENPKQTSEVILDPDTTAAYKRSIEGQSEQEPDPYKQYDETKATVRKTLSRAVGGLVEIPVQTAKAVVGAAVTPIRETANLTLDTAENATQVVTGTAKYVNAKANHVVSKVATLPGVAARAALTASEYARVGLGMPSRLIDYTLDTPNKVVGWAKGKVQNAGRATAEKIPGATPVPPAQTPNNVIPFPAGGRQGAQAAAPGPEKLPDNVVQFPQQKKKAA